MEFGGRTEAGVQNLNTRLNGFKVGMEVGRRAGKMGWEEGKLLANTRARG